MLCAQDWMIDVKTASPIILIYIKIHYTKFKMYEKSGFLVLEELKPLSIDFFLSVSCWRDLPSLPVLENQQEVRRNLLLDSGHWNRYPHLKIYLNPLLS